MRIYSDDVAITAFVCHTTEYYDTIDHVEYALVDFGARSQANISRHLNKLGVYFVYALRWKEWVS